MKKLILEGTFNTRDIGGWQSSNGKRVQYGRMYRSDALNNLTSNDVQVLQSLNLKTIVDFRSVSEADAAPDKMVPGTTTINLSPHAAVAALGSGNIVDDREKIDALLLEAATEEGRQQLKNRADEMADQMRELVSDPYAIEQYKKFIDLLTDEKNLPLLHHCKGGKDRTGYGALLTLLIVDVPIDTVKEEYLLTGEAMAQRNEKRMAEYRQYTDNSVVLTYLSGLMQTKELYFDAAIEEMIRLGGSIDEYLKNWLDVTEEKRNQIKKLFLED